MTFEEELNAAFAPTAPQADTFESELESAFAPQAPESTFGDRMSEISQRRRGEAAQTMADYEAGKINEAEVVLQTTGKLFFGTLADAVGEIVKTGAHETVSALLSEKTADEAEAWLSEQIASGANAVMSTDEAKELLNWYQGLDPNTRKNIESVTNIVTSLTPASTGKASLKGGLKLTGKALQEHAAKGKILRQKKQLSKTALDNSPDARRARGQGVPTQVKIDNDILDTLLSTKGVRAGAKPEVNKEVVIRAIDELDNTVFKALDSVTTAIPAGVVRMNVKRNMDKMIKEIPSMDLSRPFNKRLNKELGDILTLEMKNFDGTASGLRKLRTAFDKAIEREAASSKSIFKGQHRKSPMVKAYRDAMNNLMDMVAEQKGIDVKSLRNRQHKLILARDNLAAMEGKVKGKLDKVRDFAQAHPYLTAGLFSQSSILLKPFALAAAAVGVPSYGLYKGVTAPATRQLLGETGELLGTAAPTATRSMFYGSEEEQ